MKPINTPHTRIAKHTGRKKNITHTLTCKPNAAWSRLTDIWFLCVPVIHLAQRNFPFKCVINGTAGANEA